MKVDEFVKGLKETLHPKDFAGVCLKAKRGEMGFGPKSNDWGSRDGRG